MSAPLTIAVCLLCIACLAGCATADGMTDKGWIDLHGYRVDAGRVSRGQLADTLPTLEHQMRLIEAAQLPEAVMNFFRGVPIVIDPKLTGMNGAYNRLDGTWVVRARPGHWPPDRAILLHELLHAYHREILQQPTPAVGEAYTQALRSGIYPPEYRDAYFMSNGREFFAVIAEIYISGPTYRPPFSCAAVAKAQPRFITWLAGMFGERECR